MQRELDDLLHSTAAMPTSDVDAAAIVDRAQRRRRTKHVAAAAVAVFAVSSAAVFAAVNGGLNVDADVEVADRPPGDAATADEEAPRRGPSTGEPSWSHATTMSGSYLASAGALLAADSRHRYVAAGFSQDGHGSAIRAYEAQTGEFVWEALSDDAVFLQLASDDVVLANTQFGPLFALDAETGERRWELALPEGYGAVTSVLADDLVVVIAGAPTQGDYSPPLAVALELGTGEELWRASLLAGTQPQWSTPVVAQSVVVVQTTPVDPAIESGNTVHALDLANGEMRWSVDVGGVEHFTPAPAVATEGLVHVKGPGGGIVTLDAATGNVQWRHGDGVLLGALPTHALLVVRPSDPQRIRAIEPTTGLPLDGIDPIDIGANIIQRRVTVHGSFVAVLTERGIAAVDQTNKVSWEQPLPLDVHEVLVTHDDLLIADLSGTVTSWALSPGSGRGS